MLTRLEVNGFKNLVDFTIDFGPYTCIAGPNGVGKSNIFDAIQFLSLLTGCTINEAALRVRNAGEDTGDIADLFFNRDVSPHKKLTFGVEMIVDRVVSDDFGRGAKASSSFLRYDLEFRYETPSPSSGHFGGLVLEREQLRPITTGNASQHLRFPHSKSQFRDSAVYNNRHSRSGFISTEGGDGSGPTTIVVHQDGGSHGRGRPAPAAGAARTIIGAENSAATPTILAARREMQNWRSLALEPAAMRRPDRYTQVPGLGADGSHIPATLLHQEIKSPDEDVCRMVASRLAQLVPVKSLSLSRDDVRQLLSLQLEEESGLQVRASSISDGTLRFLALVVLAEVANSAGLYCMEEPENGIHPEKLSVMYKLLKDIASDPWYAVGSDNPLRQVIVATHSPFFVQLQDREDLVIASQRVWIDESEAVNRTLRCSPCKDAWRCYGNRRDYVDPTSLLTYLLPPDEAQIALPPSFWESL